MSFDLSDRARSVLCNVKQALRQTREVQRASQSPAMQDLLAWCEQQGLETNGWFADHRVVFQRNVIRTIEQVLAESHLLSLEQWQAQPSRREQADMSHVENKSLGLAPMERRVLMAQANCGHYFPEWVTVAPSQWVMDLDWQTLNLQAYEWVVMVENRDAFYEYFALHPQRYQLPEDAFNALVIYRGNGLEAKGCKGLREACVAAGKKLVYFGDYDHAGLSFALHGNYSHIMLPTVEYLYQRANDAMQGAQQIEYLAALKGFAEQLADADPLKALLLHNTERQKGLTQQAFQGPLQLLPINR